MRYVCIFNYMIVGLFIMTGCTTTIPSELNYMDDNSWVAKPTTINKSVDVFYVYPTIYVEQTPPNMDISDPQLRKNAKGLLTAQAGIYSPYANLFAPFYRQQSAFTQSMEPNNGGRDAFADPRFLTGYHDVERAFDYYTEHLNPDRPFILAGHSQGSMVVIHLLRNRLQNPVLQKRMLAAYPIGYTVKKDDLYRYPWMKLAQGETDTGVIITFNTEGKDAKGSPVLLNDAVAINQLNWKTDGTPAPREKNMEAVFFNDSTGEVLERIPRFAGAYIDTKTGALIATDIQTPKSDKIDLTNMGRWPSDVYHRYDYAFWYGNLKENVKKRIDAYHAEQTGK
jgi:pimeloyl-ACP methyl ester carboxylesterase